MQGMTNLIQKDTGDGTILILPWAYSAITQGTWAFSISTGYAYNSFLYNSSAAESDQIDYKVYLSKGAWNVTIEAYLGATGADVQILIDSVLVGQVLLYAGTTKLARLTTQPFNISTTGLKTLSLKALSSGYGLATYLYSILLQRAN